MEVTTKCVITTLNNLNKISRKLIKFDIFEELNKQTYYNNSNLHTCIIIRIIYVTINNVWGIT